MESEKEIKDMFEYIMKNLNSLKEMAHTSCSEKKKELIVKLYELNEYLLDYFDDFEEGGDTPKDINHFMRHMLEYWIEHESERT